jgi:hypothetical protein
MARATPAVASLAIDREQETEETMKDRPREEVMRCRRHQRLSSCRPVRNRRGGIYLHRHLKRRNHPKRRKVVVLLDYKCSEEGEEYCMDV